MKKEAAIYYEKKLNSFLDREERILKQEGLNLDGVKNVHISAACGKAMASVAGLFIDSGYKVTGSDTVCYPPMSNVLEDIGLEYSDFDKKNIDNKDLVVIGNVCSPSFEEPKYARENNITQISGAEAVGEIFMRNKKTIVCAGTHGKTTTTSMAVEVFRRFHSEPGFLIGGVLESDGKSYSIGDKESRHFIIEGDEYDTAYFDKAPKFLHYKPSISIITSVEFDHADIYKDIDEYRKAFEFLAQETKDKILIWDRVENIEQLVCETESEVLRYGFNESSDIYINNIKQTKEGQMYDLSMKEEKYESIFLPMSGKHNVLNSAAVFAAAILEGLDEKSIKDSFSNFKGVKKRQEIIFENEDVVIIDDFAHHPTAVDFTLRGLREKYPENRLVAIFEPRSSTSRKKIFEDLYKESFAVSDLVYIKEPPFKENDSNSDFFDVKELASELNQRDGIESFSFDGVDSIVKDYLERSKKGDVVVFMSNGNFDGIGEKLKKVFTDLI